MGRKLESQQRTLLRWKASTQMRSGMQLRTVFFLILTLVGLAACTQKIARADNTPGEFFVIGALFDLCYKMGVVVLEFQIFGKLIK